MLQLTLTKVGRHERPVHANKAVLASPSLGHRLAARSIDSCPLQDPRPNQEDRGNGKKGRKFNGS